MSRILIFGSQGKVGTSLTSYLITKGYDVVASRREDCDLRDQTVLEQYILEQKATTIINCAAISGIEACWEDPVACHYVNVIAPQTMARLAKQEGIKLIHLSTDYVLDGRRPGLKSESDKVFPINTYGESKAEAEWRVMDECPDALIARISWVFGSLAKPGFAEMIWCKLIAGEAISAISDKDSIPTWLPDLCEWLEFLVLNPDLSGIYHLCNSGEPLTWADYAQLVIQAAVKHGAVSAMPTVETQTLKEVTCFKDPRPLHTSMSSEKLANAMQKPVRTYREAIDLAIGQMIPKP